MFSYGQRSKCADLLNSYNNFKKHIFLNIIFKQANKPEEKYYLPENMNSKFTEQQFPSGFWNRLSGKHFRGGTLGAPPCVA